MADFLLQLSIFERFSAKRTRNWNGETNFKKYAYTNLRYVEPNSITVNECFGLLYRFPFYYELKVIIVIWLLSPVTRGSSIMYRRVIHPLFMRREQVIVIDLLRLHSGATRESTFHYILLCAEIFSKKLSLPWIYSRTKKKRNWPFLECNALLFGANCCLYFRY